MHDIRVTQISAGSSEIQRLRIPRERHRDEM